MSFSTVVDHKFGLYSNTRSILSTSKSGPVPDAFINTTGLSSAILMPSSNITLGLCSVRSAITKSASIRSFMIVDWIKSLPCLLAVFTLKPDAFAAGVIMLRSISAKKPGECPGSRSTNGRITNAVSFEDPSASAIVIVSGPTKACPLPSEISTESGIPEVIPRYWQFSRMYEKIRRAFPDQDQILYVKYFQDISFPADYCLYNNQGYV
jgi:hypothetical protein